MSDMRQRLVARFRDIAVDRLERINTSFVTIQSAPTDAEQAKFLKREVHTLKGESRMTGFATISEVCHRVEELMEGVGEQPLKAVRVDAIFSGLDVIESLVGMDPTTPSDVELVAAWDVDALAALGLESTKDPALGRSATVAPAPRRRGAQQTPKPQERQESPPTEAATAVKEAEAPAVTRQGSEMLLRVSLNRLDQVTRVSGDLALDHVRGERALDDILQQVTALGRSLRDTHSTLIRLGRPEDASRDDLLRGVHAVRTLHEDQRTLQQGLQSLVQRADDDDFDLGLKLMELDERVRELRFLPLSSLFGRFPRAVHDLARSQDKSVTLEIRGGNIELDKQVLDRVAEPLLHLVRNAVDHGIELPEERTAAGKSDRARILLQARTLGSAVEITIEDDGRGVDPARVRHKVVERGLLTAGQVAERSDEQLMDHLFDAGFSTRDVVTEISGRGVGLAVVKDTVDQLGGTATVRSRHGEWTRFVLRVPTSVVLARVLLIRLNDRVFAFPVDLVRSTLTVKEEELETVADGQAIRIGEQVVPVIQLAAVLGVRERALPSDRLPVLIVEHRGRAYGLRVSSFAGQHQAVQRPLDRFVSGMRLYHGAVGTPDGDLALLLSVPEVVARGFGSATLPTPVALEPQSEAGADMTVRARVLVVDDSEFTRDLVVGVVRSMALDVVEAVNGRQGLDRFLEHPPDLVLTDLDMPVMDGFEMLAEIRRRPGGARVPIVVFSTRGSPEDKERAAALGADAYVVKTEFREAVLRAMVLEFLDDAGRK